MGFSSVSRISATFARAASVVLGLQRVAQTKAGQVRVRPRCIGKRIIVLNLQIESDNVIHLVITGNTYNFRGRMDWRGNVRGVEYGS